MQDIMDLKSIQEAYRPINTRDCDLELETIIPKGKQVEYVLENGYEGTTSVVQMKNEQMVEVIDSFIVTGIERTMNEANKIEFIV